MKKTIAVILLATVLLCSCNLDGSKGLLRKVSESEKSQDYTILSYCGHDADNLFILTANGIESVSPSGQPMILLSNAVAGMVIRQAAYSYDGSIYFLAQENDDTNSTVWGYYDTALDEFGALVDDSDRHLITGNFDLKLEGTTLTVSNYGGPDFITIENCGSICETFSADDEALGKDSLYIRYFDEITGKYIPAIVVFDGTDLKKYNVSAGENTTAFKAICTDGTTYALVYTDKSIYTGTLTVEDGDNTFTDTGKNLNYAFPTGTASFCKEPGVFVFKTNSSYDEVKVTAEETAVTSVTSGYAEGMVTQTIAAYTTGAGKVVVVTYANGCFTLDPANNSKEPY